MKIESEVIEGKRGNSYPALKQLGSGIFENMKPQFQLPAYAQRNLSAAQSAELIACHFSQISQEFEPLDLRTLPPNISQFLSSSRTDIAPELSYLEVYTRIIKAKKPNSSVPGDLPKKLVQHCAITLAIPATIIFNKIKKSMLFPK